MYRDVYLGWTYGFFTSKITDALVESGHATKGALLDPKICDSSNQLGTIWHYR